MAEQIRIGRHKDNDIVVNFPEISSHHAVLEEAGSAQYMLEDIGSTNGSFVNGKRIKKTMVRPGDEIKLAHYQFSLERLLKAYKDKERIELKPDDYSKAFNELKSIYEDYLKKKLEIMKTDKKTTILKGVLAFIPYVGSGLGQISSSLSDKQEKLLLLEEDFKANYCCPKCCQFLGNIPWSNLARRNSCMYCKTEWVKK